MIRIAIDLELESDGSITGDIIQLGYSIFSTNSGKLIFTGGDCVQTGRILHPFIVNLTKITDKDIEQKGVSLLVAYDNMVKSFEKCIDDEKRNDSENSLNKNPRKYGFYQIIEWGQGDVKQLKKELDEKFPNHNWEFGRSSLNLKAAFQMHQIANNVSFIGGLKTSMKKIDLEVIPYLDEVAPGKFRQRTFHDARMDALSTARVYLELQRSMKNKNESA